MSQLPFSRNEEREARVGDLVYFDICGPMKYNSFGEAKVMAVFVNDHFVFLHVKPMKYKSQIFEGMEDVIIDYRAAGHDIRQRKFDNLKEFPSEAIITLMRKYSIKLTHNGA